MLALLRTFNVDKLKDLFLQEGFLTREGELLKRAGFRYFGTYVCSKGFHSSILSGGGFVVLPYLGRA